MTTVLRFKTSRITGISTAKILLTRMALCAYSPKDASARCCSNPARLKARITRTPVRFSRRTRLILSRSVCSRENSGSARAPMSAVNAHTITIAPTITIASVGLLK